MVWEQIKKKLRKRKRDVILWKLIKQKLKSDKKIPVIQTGIVQNGRMLIFSGTANISSDKKSIIVKPQSTHDNYFISIEGLKKILKGKQMATGLVSWMKIDDEISGVV